MTGLDYELLINKSNAVFWEFDVNTNVAKWSEGFYRILNYEIGEIACSYRNFIDDLLYDEDRDLFLNSINGQNVDPLKSTQIRLLTKRGYEWFQSTMQKQKNAWIIGILIPIHEFKLAEFGGEAMRTLVSANSRLLQAGSWSLNCSSGKLNVREETLRLLDAEHRPETLADFLGHFESADRIQLGSAIADCQKYGRPFESDVSLKTAGGQPQWIKIKGRARIDQFGTCTEIKGTLQNINWSKENESRLEALLKRVSRQKDQLQNYAHIVAHNMNSYSNNLKRMVDLYGQLDAGEEREDIFAKIRDLSSSLKITIGHLNEIVSSEAQDEDQSIVEFDQVLHHTMTILENNIRLADATINSNFSECQKACYVPAYLESIFHNLISNALKYREPTRKAQITCESKKIDGDVHLIFEDNGIGIDMEKYGDKLFGMFQTFHRHQDAHGLGLYMTRNQVEQLGGSIRVESELNKGTKFIIRLNAGADPADCA